MFLCLSINLLLSIIFFLTHLIEISSQKKLNNISARTDISTDDDYWKLMIPEDVNSSLDSTVHIIKLKEVRHRTNPFHSCYNMLCDNSTGLCGHELQRSFCYPAIIVTGFPKCGTSAMYELLGRYQHAIKMKTKENCPFLHPNENILSYFRSLPLMSSVGNHSLIIDGCIQTNLNMAMRSILHNPRTFYIFLIRDYANLVWAAYNFWCHKSIDKVKCIYGSEHAVKKYHTRSPELFHQLVLSDVTIVNNHSCADAHLFFTSIIDSRLLLNLPPHAITVLSAEAMEKNPSHIANLIADKVGLDVRGFKIGNFSHTRINSQLRLGSHETQIEEYTPGIYEISDFKPMLNETRRILNRCWYSDCKLIAQRYGYIYPACNDHMKKSRANRTVL